VTIQPANDATATNRELGRPGVSWTGDGGLTPELHPASTPHPAYRDAVRATVAPSDDLARASFGRRAVGYAIDVLIIGVLWLIVGALFFPNELGAYLDGARVSGGLPYVIGGVPLAYNWLFNSLGWSPGKRAAGLSLVDAEGRRPGGARGLGRTLASILSSPFHIGYIWATFDPETRTWHDRLAKTWVVVAPEAEEPSPQQTHRGPHS
jgi:uncharacterized RDD family membrane protein YckC